METVFFYYTLIVITVCLSTTVSSLAALAVSNNSKYVYYASMFAFYALDLVVIFQSESLNSGTLSYADFYGIADWPLKMVLAAGVLQSAWLIVCSFIGEKRLFVRIFPVAIFCVASCLFALLIPDVAPFWRVRQMLFFSTREAFIFFMFIYGAVHYLCEKNPQERQRLRSAKWVYLVGVPLTCCIVAENAFIILIYNPSVEDLRSLMLLYLSSRNFSENTLIVACAAITLRDCWRTLSSHSYLMGRTAGTSESQAYIESLLPAYSNKHNLTKREMEILRLIIQGHDNQNIASQLQVALGTVKSHTHNIMRKTNTNNRDELIKDFWSTL